MGVDPMRGDQRAHARLVSGIADDECCVRRHRPAGAGLLSGYEKVVNHWPPM